MAPAENLDFLIIGAGISGIGAACHLVRDCPTKRFTILEQRDEIGGTWDIFRYPGVRCDSDMYSFGYSFRPWPSDKVITDGSSIRDYLHDTVDEYGLGEAIRFRHRVESAEWSSTNGLWTVTAVEQTADGPLSRRYRCKFLLMCPGYFRYDRGYTPAIPGLDAFEGPVIHPQFWPDDFELAGQRIVVIGSGATATTLVPALAQGGAQVTMLQRSPTYYVSLPSIDPTVRLARRLLPGDWVSRAALIRNTLLQVGMYHFCRWYPERAKSLLLSRVKTQLGDAVDMRHFTPDYAPWDQRICAVPDGDLFNVLRDGQARIVTDHIDHIDRNGIALRSGTRLDADAIVTATGFAVRLFGGIRVTVNGVPVDPAERVMYRAAMLDEVPNFGMIFGYTNVSWTRKVDLVSAWICRLTRYMDRVGVDVVVPSGGEWFASDEPFLDLKSGFASRAQQHLPRQGSRGPWRTRNNVVLDTLALCFGPLESGHVRFERTHAVAPTGAPPQWQQ